MGVFPDTNQIYAMLPHMLQNVACSWYGIRQRRLFYGHGFDDYYKWLLQTQYWDSGAIAHLQADLLHSMVTTAVKYSSYYRKLHNAGFIEPDDIHIIDDIRHLPLLSKETLRSRSNEFVNEQMQPSQIVIGRTSGTTGKALQVSSSKHAMMKVWAAMERMRSWYGVSRNQRRASCTGKIYVPTDRDPSGVYWRHDWSGHRILLSVYHLSPTTAQAYVETLQRFCPAFLDGYPSSLRIIANYLADTNQRIPSIKAVFPTAETLDDQARMELENAFGVPVVNQYGSTELVSHVAQCEFGQLHVSPEIGYIELLDIDGNPTKPGEVGEIVVTGFVNDAMPMIRYRTGDLALAMDSSEQCRCGRQMPLLGRILGRLDDTVITRDGRRLPIINYHVFKWASHIIEAQVVQKNYDQFEFLVVRGVGFDEVEIERAKHELIQRLGHEASIEVQYVDEIPRGPNGKFRAVLSRLATAQVDNATNIETGH